MSTRTITYPNFRAIFNRKIGDIPVTATTDGVGATDTAIASSLREYYTSSGGRNLFHDWWCYIPAQTSPALSQQERRVENFDPEKGALKFYAVLSGATASGTAIELHKWQVSKKLLIINDTLEHVCKDGFYNPTYDETLWGQEEYGDTDDVEFNKRTYTVPTSFEEFPDKILLVEGYIGRHTGDDDATILTDSSKAWKTNELVGLTIYNKTDGSKGTVLSNTSTTVTATEAGGTGNDWDEDDEYIIQKPDARPFQLTDFTIPRVGYGGGFTFIATIPEKYLIKLVGKGPLTNFSTEAGTTELYNHEAEVVAERAAYEWFKYLANSAAGQDIADCKEKAADHWAEYERSRPKRAMAEQRGIRMDWKW